MHLIKIISLSSYGSGLSGGDRIWIEFAANWSKKNIVEVVTWNAGYKMFLRQKIRKKSGLCFYLINNRLFDSFFIVSYISRIIAGVFWGLTVDLSKVSFIYSSSEFWMDSFPAVIIKLRKPKIKWVASWYQTAPNPLIGYSYSSQQKRYRFRSLLYWLAQLPVRFLIDVFADFVLVNNEQEKRIFHKLYRENRVFVVLGAVDTQKILYFQSKLSKVKKQYDVVFQGRFHPQKGVEELIEIWKLVIKKKPSAILVMIGDGPLMTRVKSQISRNKLEDNILLKGYLFDGKEKYQIFSQAKVVVHPSLFDSGGMAAAEAMAFGLPAVGFDLLAYQFYYPSGMIKVKIADYKSFAASIIRLLDNSGLRSKIGGQARKMIFRNYSWRVRAEEVLKYIS